MMKIDNRVGKGSTIAAVIVLGIVVSIIVAALLVWPTMLMFGVVHGFYAAVPAFGLWETFLVTLLVRLVVGYNASSK